jgi:hypothetical protein
MSLVEREDVAQRSDAVVGVGVLHQQLDSDRERQRPGDLLGDPDREQRRDPERQLDGLVERVLHEAVEPVGALDRVMYGVQAPQRSPAVAEPVRGCDAEIEDDDRPKYLNDERKPARPDIG